MAVFLLIMLLMGQVVTALEDTGWRLSSSHASEYEKFTYCFNGTSPADAETVANTTCRQLGYSEQGRFTNESKTTPSNGINDNWLSPIRKCSDVRESCSQNITLVCKRAPCTDGEIRVVGETSTNKTEGRVDTCLNGRWGTVQNNQPSQEAVAQAVCHMLSATLGYFMSIPLGDDEIRPIYSCLAQYPHSGKLDCNDILESNNHSEGLGIVCHHSLDSTDCSGQDMGFRLVNGDNYSEGRVEVCTDGQWGVVCSSSQEGVAEAVCTNLGFSSKGSMVIMSTRINTLRHTYECDFINDLNCTKLACNDSMDLRVMCSASSRYTTILLYTVSGVLAAALAGWLCTCFALWKNRLIRSKKRSNSRQIRTQRNTSYSENAKIKIDEKAIPIQTLVPNYDNKVSYDEDEDDFYDRLQYNQLQTNTAEVTPTLTRDEAGKREQNIHYTEAYAKVTVEYPMTNAKRKKSGVEEPPVHGQTTPGEASWGPQKEEYSKLQY